MGFMKFMEDNEQLYIERQIDHGVSMARPGDRENMRRKGEIGKQKWKDPGGKTIPMM